MINFNLVKNIISLCFYEHKNSKLTHFSSISKEANFRVLQQPFFHPTGELALNPKYDNISHWTDHNKFKLKDYILPTLDDL
jgi:hypothetical protein